MRPSGLWLDHAATSLPRRAEALAGVAEAADLASPGRGLHDAARAGEVLLEQARRALLDATGLNTPGRVLCFLPGTTAALGQAILGFSPRPRALALGPLVHNAVRRPALSAADRVWTLPHDEEGRIDLARVDEAWREGTDLVCVEHASNVTGLVQPVAELVAIAHHRGARVIVDAAQTAGALPALDVGDADLIAFGAHKAFAALPGVGALVVRGEIELTPRSPGGTGFDAAAADMPEALPARLEGGTLPLALIAGWARAAARAGPPPVSRGELEEVLRSAGVEPVGHGQLGLVSGRVPGSAPTEVEQMLDHIFGITVRAGLHCAPTAHEVLGSLGEGGLVRFSVGHRTSPADLDALRRALTDLARARGRAA